ncbi:MAG: UDP-2,3-diacylglucosamine diphosphatase [Bacteroidetes bacterium]|nr:UDP-2,3-diacylglucosamine diphosphatase [Bacteroidota bacterium]
MKKFKKRKVDLVVISDIHLGTYGCRGKEVLNYLKTIKPKTLVLNGDIIDMWQFSKRYFPKSHMEVLMYIASLVAKGTKVYYVTGNHDEMLRKFTGMRLGTLEIVNKVMLDLNGEKAWIFHGDVFDVTMQYSKWLAKLGGFGYDLLIHINTFVNWCSERLGGRRISLSKKIKNSVKSAVKFINNFEETAADIAISNGYEYVICGHIHHPQMKTIIRADGKRVKYLNSGDWIENLTSLEYHKGSWSLYEYMKDPIAQNMEEIKNLDLDATGKAGYKNKELFNEMLKEFLSSHNIEPTTLS